MIDFDSASFVTGMNEAIEGLSESLGESTLRKTGFAGALIFRSQVERNALRNIKTGVLFRNIIVKRIEEESESNQKQTYLVTVRSGKHNTEGDAFYWRFVEKGHKFVPRNKNVSKKTGKKTRWKAHRAAAELEYGNSRVPAYPFVRPAYESKKAEAIAAMQETISKALQEGMAKT